MFYTCDQLGCIQFPIIQFAIILNYYTNNNNEYFAIMTNPNTRNNMLSALNAYKYPPGLSYDRTAEINKYSNTNNYSNDIGAPKSSYKYTYYKSYPDNQYFSKESAPIDSLRLHQRIDETQTKLNLPSEQLPSFRGKSIQQPSFQEIIDSVEYAIEPRSYSNRGNNAQLQAESQEILFLKNKLIQTHNKLIKQLDQTNRLSVQLQTSQTQLSAEQKSNRLLEIENQRLKKQIIFINAQKQVTGKSQQKFKSLQTKFFEQNKRNSQLKDDLQTMRTKMLQALMAKNNYQQENQEIKAKINIMEENTTKLRHELRQKEQAVEYLSKQLQIIRKKFEQCELQCQHRAEQIHQYNHLATQREKALNSVQIELKREKQRNASGIGEFAKLQSEHKALMKKLDDLEDMCEKYKGEIYLLQNNKQYNSKALHEQLEKLTNDFNVLNNKYRQKERQLEMFKKKPAIESVQKRKNFENTKQFVNKLQNEQFKIQQTSNMRRQKINQKANAGRGTNQAKTTRNKSISPGKKYQNQNPITHQPITHIHSSDEYQEDRGRYIDMLDQVGNLQTNLYTYNIEKKKMLTEIDKIDDTKVKTKEMITRRRKLEEELGREQQKIKKAKEQLKKAKVL